MTRKYLVSLGEEGPVAALRYDLKRETLLIGGRMRMKEDLSSVAECFGVIFDFTVWKTYGRTGIIRAEVSLPAVVWSRGLDRLESRGYVLERVKGFRRFMR